MTNFMFILKPKMELRAKGMRINYSAVNVIFVLCLVQLGKTDPSDSFKSAIRNDQNLNGDLHTNRPTNSNENNAIIETDPNIESRNTLFRRNVPDNDTDRRDYTKSSSQMVNLDSLRDRYFERGQDFYKEQYENETYEEKDTTIFNEPTFGLLIDQQTNTVYYNQQNKESSTNSINETSNTYSDKELTIGRVTYEDFISSVDQETTTVESDNYTEEVCVGQVDYCNLTKEEYIALLDDYIFPMPYEWVLIASHMVVFFVGLIGNALVCVAVYRNHSMRTVTNYFIVNLAVADFMVILFCLPPTVLWDVTETWFFGNAMCRIVLYFQVSRIFIS